MKIALICTEKLPVPPILGGAIQIYIEGILPELSKHHEITVFCIKHESLPDEEEINGVKYIRVAGSNKAEYVRNLELKLDDSYDLIHVFNRPRWVVRLSKRLPRTKFSLSLHNEMLHKEKIPREMGLACIRRVEFITTVSEFIADGVLKLFPEAEGKIYTVYSGVDVDRFKPVMSEDGMLNKEILKKELGIEDKFVRVFVTEAVGQGCLRVSIHNQDFLAPPCQPDTKAGRRDGFSNTSFLVDNGNGFSHSLNSFFILRKNHG